MAKAFKCDMTGRVCEGSSIREVRVRVSKTFELMVTPLEVLDEAHMTHGEISPEAAEAIKAALAVLVEKQTKK